MRKLLIVTDGKAGHENQSKALCEALGMEYDLAAVSYPNGFMKALSCIADNAGILTERLYQLDCSGTEYSAVICTGSTAFYPGKVTARKFSIPVCAILMPRGYRLDYDCILAPTFDHPPAADNIIPLPVNLTAVNTEFYSRATAEFLKRHAPAKPAAAVIVGGANNFAELSAEWMRKRLDEIFAATGGMERWVTTSRRTPPEVEEVIDSYAFDYKLIFSRDKFNPIPAFVTSCETLFVTADSTGMISEAVTRGSSKVEILMNLCNQHCKFAHFIQELQTRGCVHLFDGTTGDASHKIDLSPIVQKVRERLFKVS
jgi:mitochondrial fission protein ELM1